MSLAPATSISRRIKVRFWLGGCHRWSDAPPSAHYAEVIAAGREGGRGARSDLAALAADSAQPAIVRATALELLRPFGQTSVGSRACRPRQRRPAGSYRRRGG